MLQATRLLYCDHCSAATAVCQRGWRAYVTTNRFLQAELAVACPDCAEQLFGDDETALAD
jgi:hypothetical protein